MPYIEIGIFAGFQHYVYEYPIGEEEGMILYFVM
jgi:hypothetical protein